ncbi:MAG TPA: hypothetical protein DCO79_02385 [Spirochaeta sp.]|nr:hypothetical protein [Spirochaeta sp.]
MKNNKFRRRLYRQTILILILSIFIFAGCSYRPTFSPADIDADVTILETRQAIEIAPINAASSNTGLLFYPGGLVDSRVYTELLADFTETAKLITVILKMPANLAIFDIDAGLSVITDYPEITDWIIAGHSLGGSMAAATVSENPDVYSGLIFMDSYPADGDSLKTWPGNVLTLFSSIEKVNEPERMQKTLDLIPPATWLTDASRLYPSADSNYTVIHQIDGGSHSYFGTYGPQDGDYTPTVSRADFHEEVIDYMLEFFTENGWI